MQGYPQLEYIVIDGGSTDGSLDIIKKYRKSIDTFVSRPDDGQYYAIQEGLDLAKGDILAWLNADDIYHSWTFSVVENIFQEFPEVDWIMGRPCKLNKIGQCTTVSSVTASYPRSFIRGGLFQSSLAGYLQQESMFWRRRLWEKVGGLNLDLQYAADFDLWIRFAEHAELVSVDVPLAAFRRRPGEQKSSMNNKYQEEVGFVCQNMKSASKLWKYAICRNSLLRNLYFLSVWNKGKIISYSIPQERWIIKSLRRVPSRVGLLNMLLERR